MKKLLILLVAFIAVLGFNACSSEDDVVFVAQPDAEGINFTSSISSSTHDLTEAAPEDVVERFAWNTVDYGVPTNENYELQAAVTSTFDTIVEMGSTSGNTLDVTVQQIMGDLTENAELDADNAIMLYFRVVGSAGTEGGMPHISETQEFTVILPKTNILPHFYLVGDATAAGWDPANNNTPLFRDPANPNIFYFTGRFAGGAEVEGFKFLETQEWQPQWGLNGGNLASSEVLGADPDAFPVENDAFYSFMVNVDEMTYTFEEYDASGAATYPTIGLIGDATPSGWDADTDMTQSEFNPHIWYLNDVELIDGFIKFRANDAWDVSWGAETPISGLGTLGGPDIPATAGIYDIWFNDLIGRYILIPQVTE